MQLLVTMPPTLKLAVIADQSKLEPLLAKMVPWLAENFNSVVGSEEFARLSKETILLVNAEVKRLAEQREMVLRAPKRRKFLGWF